MVCHEVLHRACHSILQSVPAYEVVCDLALIGVGGAAIGDGHGAIEVRLGGRRGAIVQFGHDGSGALSGRGRRRKLAPTGGLGLPGLRGEGVWEKLDERDEDIFVAVVKRRESKALGGCNYPELCRKKEATPRERPGLD